jgi:hypothetical protein
MFEQLTLQFMHIVGEGLKGDLKGGLSDGDLPLINGIDPVLLLGGKGTALTDVVLECHVDHVHMFVSALPQLSIPEIMKLIKGYTSVHLREEFTQLRFVRNLWTRSYFVSTAGNVSAETIQRYVETQKTRS